MEDLKTPISPFYRMENKPVDLDRGRDFCTVLLHAMACKTLICLEFTHIQNHCDCIEQKRQGLEAEGCRGDLWGGGYEMPCASPSPV